MNTNIEHHCENKDYQIDLFFQQGQGLWKNILILGESLAENGWRKSSKAFYTPNDKIVPTGRNLNKFLDIIGTSITNCSFTEIAKCYIGKDRNLLHGCGKKCWPLLEDQISFFGCKIIVSLGLVTLDILNKQLGTDAKPGELITITIRDKEYWLLPIYHPSPINPYNHQKNMEIGQKNKEKIISIISE